MRDGRAERARDVLQRVARARTGRLTARRSCALGTSYSASLVSMTLLRLSAHATSLISFLSGACRQVCSRTPEG
jgi:hypothetical protein